jgi:hypothetical protein
MGKIKNGAEALLGKCPECDDPYTDHCVDPIIYQRWNSQSKLKARACRVCGCDYYLTASK